MSNLFDLILGGDGTGSGIDSAIGQNPRNTAPAKADAAATPTIATGLVDALNKYQAELVKKGTYQIADEYEIVIVSDSLKSAKIVPPGSTDFRQPPMIKAKTAGDAKLGSKQTVDKNAKNVSAFAGMSLIQFIDQYTRTSTYIYDQQNYIIDPDTKRPIPQGIPGQVLAWYRIGLQAVPKTDAGIDEKRNDYAYRITYQISPYKVNDVKSEYFPTSQYQGVHKRYDYWFTGQNRSVLKFEQDFNTLYFVTINAPDPAGTRTKTSNPNEYITRVFSPRSAQPSTGQDAPVNEPGANAADYLYSPADQGEVNLTIVGDPAWIQQGELWSGIAGTNLIYGPFLPDGTINYEGQEILFLIAFNKPVDYDLSTGLMDAGKNNYKADREQSRPGEAVQQYVYKATEVVSTFSRGQFTQDLKGVIMQYDLPGQQTPSGGPDQTDAETARLARQNLASAPRPASRGAVTTPQASALGSTNGAVTFEGQVGSEFGAYFNDGTTASGAVADPKPRPRNPAPPPGSLFEAEGFAAPEIDLAPAPAPTPPTSSGQVVGPAASGAGAVASQGGASGAGVGAPVTVQVFTRNGVVNVSSQREIERLRDDGEITVTERRQAAQALSLKQRAASSPTSSQPNQRISRDA